MKKMNLINAVYKKRKDFLVHLFQEKLIDLKNLTYLFIKSVQVNATIIL